MEPSETSGRRKLEAGAGVDRSERDRGWERCWMRKPWWKIAELDAETG